MTISMRDAFLDELYGIAREDRQVLFLSNDFGAPSLDKFRADLPGQFIHMGSSGKAACRQPFPFRKGTL